MQNFIQSNPVLFLIIFFLFILGLAVLWAKFGGGGGSSGGGFDFDGFDGGGDD